jgi:hypothetical protein
MDAPHVETPRLVVRRELIAAGWTDRELRRQQRTGELLRLARGIYLPAPDAPPRFEARHALLAAVRDEREACGVLSHVSAALLHGMSTWGLPLDRVHRTRDRRTGGRVGEGVHVHAAPLDPGEVVELDGRLVTTAARTVIDVARTAGFEAAVAVADSALHKHLTDPDELARAVRRCTGWPGAPQARRVVAAADGDSESVGESVAGSPSDGPACRSRSCSGRSWVAGGSSRSISAGPSYRPSASSTGSRSTGGC